MKFNFKKDEPHPHHRHISLLLVATILLLIIIFILIKPALIGYKISEQLKDLKLSTSEYMKSLDLVKSNLLIAETKLESCTDMNKDLVQSISSEKNLSFKYIHEITMLEAKSGQLKNEYEFNLSRVRIDYEQRKNEIEAKLNQNELLLDKTLKDYAAIAQNSADNICCKSRVDDKRIDSYIISNNAVSCTSGEENKIDCS